MRSLLLSLMCFVPLACSGGGPVGRDTLLDNALLDGGAADGAATACKAAGGTCTSPGPASSCAVEAPASAQDCAPADNPGGITCCLSETAADAAAGSRCEAAGGKCVLGNVSCSDHAPDADQDCNPDRNPGGAFCCLSNSCKMPPAPIEPDGGSGLGCVAKKKFEICQTSPKSCHDACTSSEYAMTCTGSDPSSIPDPSPSLGCTAIPIPTPSNALYYCCPCE